MGKSHQAQETPAPQPEVAPAPLLGPANSEVVYGPVEAPTATPLLDAADSGAVYGPELPPGWTAEAPKPDEDKPKSAVSLHTHDKEGNWKNAPTGEVDTVPKRKKDGNAALPLVFPGEQGQDKEQSTTTAEAAIKRDAEGKRTATASVSHRTPDGDSATTTGGTLSLGDDGAGGHRLKVTVSRGHQEAKMGPDGKPETGPDGKPTMTDTSGINGGLEATYNPEEKAGSFGASAERTRKYGDAKNRTRTLGLTANRNAGIDPRTGKPRNEGGVTLNIGDATNLRGTDERSASAVQAGGAVDHATGEASGELKITHTETNFFGSGTNVSASGGVNARWGKDRVSAGGSGSVVAKPNADERKRIVERHFRGTDISPAVQEKLAAGDADAREAFKKQHGEHGEEALRSLDEAVGQDAWNMSGSANLTLEDEGFFARGNVKRTQGEGSAQSGFNGKLDIGYNADGSAIFEGEVNAIRNGEQTGGGVTFRRDKDGNTVWGAAGRLNGNGGDFKVHQDKDGNLQGAEVNAGTKDFGAGMSYVRTANSSQTGGGVRVKGVGAKFDVHEVKDKLTPAQVVDTSTAFGIQRDDAASALGEAYVSASKDDRYAVSAFTGAAVAGASGSEFTAARTEALAALPANWSTLSPDEQKAFLARQDERVKGIDGISGLDPRQMRDGEGFRFTTGSGWSAEAFGTTTGVTFGGGASAEQEQQTTITRAGDAFEVDLRTLDKAGGKGDVSLLGMVGFGGEREAAGLESVHFRVDANDEEAMAALATFTQTGVLPGAMNLAGEENEQRAAAFTKASERAADIKRTLAGAEALTPEQHDQMLVDLDEANREARAARTELNRAWSAEHDVGKSIPGLPGITVRKQTQGRQDEQKLNATALVTGNVYGQKDDHSVEQEVTPDGDVRTTHNYKRTETWFGEETGKAYSQSADIEGGTGWAWHMGSRTEVDSDAEWDLLAERGVLPESVVEAKEDRGWLGGAADTLQFWRDDAYEGLKAQTTVELDEKTLDQLAASMNEGEDAEALWAGMAERSDRFIGGLHTGEVGGDGYGAMGANSFVFDEELPKGMTVEQAAAGLKHVKGAEDFKKLDPEMQVVFVKSVVRGSAKAGSGNPYEAIAAANLIDDPNLRAQTYTELFEHVAKHATQEHDDPVLQFLELQKTLGKKDPALAEAMKQSTHVSLYDEQVEALSKLDDTGLAEELFGAGIAPGQRSFDSENRDSLVVVEGSTNEQEVLEVLRAADGRGPESMEAILSLAGASPEELVASLEDDPVRQRWAMEILERNGAQLSEDQKADVIAAAEEEASGSAIQVDREGGKVTLGNRDWLQADFSDGWDPHIRFGGDNGITLFRPNLYRGMVEPTMAFTADAIDFFGPAPTKP